MPNPNAIVAQAIRIDPEFGRPPATILRERADIPVQLDGERTVSISAADPRAAGYAHVLAGLAELKRPVYLEVDPGSGAITRIQVPYVARVAAIRELAPGIEVMLEPSHARHLLEQTSPWYGEFEGLLREGLANGKLLIVSEDELHNILDVRGFMPGPDDGPIPRWPNRDTPPYEPDWWRRPLLWWWGWWIWPWNWFRCISRARAQQVFDAMAATTCNPLTVPPPCIPFMYPDDGCWGRAHEMARLMIGMGLKPRKVWIQGSLHTLTRNNPACYVNWGWHVAPTLCVRTGFSSSQMVIDPSLFTIPVTQATWKGVQGDPNASLSPSAADIFYYWGNVTDPTYSQTNVVLATYRLALYNRSLAVGPPPYAACP